LGLINVAASTKPYPLWLAGERCTFLRLAIAEQGGADLGVFDGRLDRFCQSA
jgi:hypothetical protein